MPGRERKIFYHLFWYSSDFVTKFAFLVENRRIFTSKMALFDKRMQNLTVSLAERY